MELDERVRDAIRKSGKTHAEIAKAADLSQPTVNRVANGKRIAGRQTLAKLARAIPAIGEIVAEDFRRAS